MGNIKTLYILVSFLLVIAFAKDTFAEVYQKDLIQDLSKTLGFIMGQQFSLKRIKTEHPTLSMDVNRAGIEFNTTFGIAESNIKSTIKNILNDNYFEFIETMKKQIGESLKSQIISQDNASNFIKKVEMRATGKIASPMLETLLTYQYLNKPVDEFNQNFKKIYRTQGHPKAKGLDLQIEYPKSWASREGNRPNVIQFFSSKNGRGDAFALIMTKNLVEEAQGELTREDIKLINTIEGSKLLASEMFLENSLKEIANGMGMSDVREIKTKRLVIDRWPGVMIESIGEQQRLDITLTMYSRMYIAIYKKHMILLQFQIGKLPSETEEILKIKIAKFSPLFRQIANSLIIQNQY